jgi:uncharacterized protein YndB with AHSA1/START domain
VHARFSDQAVKDATGRDWSEWFSYLDDAGAAELNHPQIVKLLDERAAVESGWWRQTVANEFEKHIGRRVTGSTADANFQVGVQKTLPVDRSAAWDLVTSREGVKAWLGTDAPVPTAPGETVVSGDGHHYELKAISPGERMRFRRTDGASGEKSTVQLTLIPAKSGTSVHFHHEGLADGDERERMRDHWRSVAGKILSIV